MPRSSGACISIWPDGFPASDWRCRQFLDEPASADKRIQLIDRLFASPEYPRRMEELFHVVLMERRGDHAEWSTFLKKSFEANKPWDQLTREIILPVSER